MIKNYNEKIRKLVIEVLFTSDRCRERMSSSRATVLEDISEAFESWSQRLLDVETKIERTDDLRQNIVHSLEGQVVDGLLTDNDFRELLYVADLLINLYKTFLCRCVGVEFTDRDVLNNLLELFSLKQISKDFFIRVVMSSREQVLEHSGRK